MADESVNGYSEYYAETSFFNTRKMFVYLHLNQYDNDPDHFRITLSAALSHWNSRLAQSIHAPDAPLLPPGNDAFIDMFCKGLSAVPLYLFVFNIDLITNDAVADFFNQLLNGFFEEFHITLLHKQIQTTPSTAISESLQLSNTPIYYSLAEENTIYQDVGLQLGNYELMQIRSLTDGWPAAVDMMIQLLTAKGTQIIQNLKNHLDYWTENYYIANHTETERKKLISLSLIKEFPLEFMVRYFGWTDTSIMSKIKKNPLLRYNPENKCYHFASYVQLLFKEKQIILDSREKQNLYKSAAPWYEEHGDRIRAISYYQMLGEYEPILRLMKQHPLEKTREAAHCYLNTINRMPPEFVEQHPYLQVISGYMLSVLFRYDEAYFILKKFCRLNDPSQCAVGITEQSATFSDISAEMKEILGDAYFILANSCIFSGQLDAPVAAYYQRANQLLPNGSSITTPALNLFADFPVIFLSNPNTELLPDNLKKITLWVKELTKLTGGGFAGVDHLAAAEMAFFSRELGDVEQNCRKAANEGLENQQYDVVCSSCFLLMRLNMAKGNYKKVIENLELLKLFASEARYQGFFSMPDIAVNWLNLKLGFVHDVSDWIKYESIYYKTVLPWNYGRDRIVRSTYLLLNHQYESVVAYSESTIELFTKRGQHLMNISLYMIQSAAWLKLDETEKSANVLETVYLWCNKNNITMPIVELGSYASAAVDNYLDTGRKEIPAVWLAQLKTKINTYIGYMYIIRRQYRREHHIKESLLAQLTWEELEVLQLISQGMTSREIADSQKKTYETVRGTTRRIYEKLHARGKADAIRIASENNIEDYLSL